MSKYQRISFVFALSAILFLAGCASDPRMTLVTNQGIVDVMDNGEQRVTAWSDEARPIAEKSFPGHTYCRTTKGGSAVYDRFERTCYGPDQARESHAGANPTGWGIAIAPLIYGGTALGVADIKGDAQVEAARAIGAGLSAQDHSTRVSNGSNSTSRGGSATTSQSQDQHQGQDQAAQGGVGKGGNAASNSNAQNRTGVDVTSQGGTGHGGTGYGGTGGNAHAGSSSQNNTGVNIKQVPKSGYGNPGTR